MICAQANAVYPETKKVEVRDHYHGVEVPDPYRWLEDDNSAETAEWVRQQNECTARVLNALPERPRIRERLTKLWNYERFGVPWKEGSRYFWMHNSGLQNQRVLFVADGLAATPRVLLDPNQLSEDGTVALTGMSVSDDGKLLAYGLSRGGSDWQEWSVREVQTGKDRPDLVRWVKFSHASWAKDGSGFYYSRYDAPAPGNERKGVNEFQKLFFHQLGTPQESDRLIYERRDQREWGFHAGVTDDGHYLIIGVTRGTDPKNAVFYKDVTVPDAPVIELLPKFDADYSFIDNIGPIFLFSTDLEAPRSRVVAIDIRQSEPAHWREIVPQQEDALKAVNFINGQLICSYLKDAHSVVRMMPLDLAESAASADAAALPASARGSATFSKELALPGIGTVSGFAGKRKDTETFYAFTSFTVPGTIYRLDVATGESTVFKKASVDFDSAQYETKQVFFRSKDGTRVPMFIAHKRGLHLDGTNPAMLFGYGGFNISLTPDFSVSDLVWMERGGVYAMPNLRGGGEYGSEWHRAGRKLKKQNVFDDFIAAAEWLIENKYCAPKTLVIAGGSNGGLLVGACMTQRPELFGATLPSVGVLDMLRFHKFTIGWAWTSDYGSSDDPEQFRALLAYSPLHNLRPGVRYPATLITTADHDDRVVPAHSFKFAARLQECQAKDGPPVLIRVEVKAGHGAGTALHKVIEERSDELAFAWHAATGGTW
jgi:prolyl oligopeptidase